MKNQIIVVDPENNQELTVPQVLARLNNYSDEEIEETMFNIFTDTVLMCPCEDWES